MWLNIGNICPLCRNILPDRTIAPNNLDDNHILPIPEEAPTGYLDMLHFLAREMSLHDFNDVVAPLSLRGNAHAATARWLWQLGVR